MSESSERAKQSKQDNERRFGREERGGAGGGRCSGHNKSITPMTLNFTFAQPTTTKKNKTLVGVVVTWVS